MRVFQLQMICFAKTAAVAVVADSSRTYLAQSTMMMKVMRNDCDDGDDGGGGAVCASCALTFYPF